MKIQKNILISIIAILVVASTYISLNVLSLAEEYSQNAKETSNFNMSINKELYSLFNDNYEHYYPKEYVLCLYGSLQGQDVLIYRANAPFVINRENDSIDYFACTEKYGLSLIGTIHSHPNGICELSSPDIQIGDEVMGVQCGHDKIIFFTKTNNYSTGYYAQVA